MTVWYRIFAAQAEEPNLSKLRASCRLSGDRQGWYRAFFPLPSGEIELNRWVAEEDDFRVELNTWAAWLEINSAPDLGWLLQHVVTAAQMFTWEMEPRAPDAIAFSGMLCRFLCAETDGIYQVDGQGFFKADGTLLVRE